MTYRRILSFLVGCLALTLFACRADDGVAPRERALRPTSEDPNEWLGHIPGWHRPQNSFETQATSAKPLACSRREAQVGSAVIGPSGGHLIVGRNHLIVPPGALTAPTLITATVPAETIASIHFEPEGLQFKKPAGLVLDSTGCAEPSDHPSILYLDDNGNVLERIDAFYSNWWHAVAAPINHFSVYAIGV